MADLPDWKRLAKDYLARPFQVPHSAIHAALLGEKDKMIHASLAAFAMGRQETRQAAGLGPVALARGDAASALIEAMDLPAAQLAALKAKFGEQAVDFLTQASDALEGDAKRRVLELVREGVEERAAVATIADELGSAAERYLDTSYRTAMGLANGAAQWVTAEEPDVAELLWGYQWATAGDDRVREEHAELDGVILDKDDPFWLQLWPGAAGYNCRCVALELWEAPDDGESRPPHNWERFTSAGFGNPGAELMDAGLMPGPM